MGIHPHGCLGGAASYRRIIIWNIAGKFNIPPYQRHNTELAAIRSWFGTDDLGSGIFPAVLMACSKP